MATTKKKKITYHTICGLLLVISLCFTFIEFTPVCRRAIQMLKDLWFSLRYYVAELSGAGKVTATVNDVPNTSNLSLPIEWNEFKEKMNVFWDLFFSWDNVQRFFRIVGDKIYNFIRIVSLFVLPGVSLFLLLKELYLKENTRHNQDTKPLKLFKLFESKFFYPIKRVVVDFIKFTKSAVWKKLLIFIWLFNFSVITIFGEAIAFLLYFCVSFDFKSIYQQVVKLIMDLSYPIAFLPWWTWFIVGWVVFDKIRRSMGIKRLWHFEECNREFLESHPGALFVVGKQRSKKTTIITDMALTQEVIFREKAKEKLAEQDKMFPNFPWINIENFFKQALANHYLYTLATCRVFLKELRCAFYRFKNEEISAEIKKNVFRRFRKKYGYTYDDFIFGYDYEKYGLTYNDALGLIDLFEVLENYLQLYFIYAAPTTLLFGNYAIRTDFQWDDKGNFPNFYYDFFEIDAESVAEISQMSHIGNMDCFRLGKTFDAANPLKDGFECGVLNEMEYSKERGNQNTNAGVKATDDNVNPKNDLHEVDLKLRGQVATVAYYDFFRLLIDDQRAESLMAENKDLCDIIHIKDASTFRILLPFFAFDELIEYFATKWFDKIYYKFRNIRGDNTLLVYLMKKIYTPIHNHYLRIRNQFGQYVAKIKVWDAMGDIVLNEKGKYFISYKKTYSRRFATDAMRNFYHKKALRAKGGLNDFRQFGDIHMTVQEMDETKSLFYTKIGKVFQADDSKERKGKKAA